MLGDVVRERVDLDAATGLVMARAVFDGDGGPLRETRFVAIDLSPEAAPRPSTPHVGSRRVARPVSRLDAPYDWPAGLAGGYQRIGVFRGPDGVEVVYSDGLETMSVFELPGSLSARALPAGGVVQKVGSATGVTWTWPAGQAVTWQSGGVVFTAVSYGSPGDLLAAAASLPRPSAPSWSQRLRHACRRFVGEITGW
jgi:hypothetical protein